MWDTPGAAQHCGCSVQERLHCTWGRRVPRVGAQGRSKEAMPSGMITAGQVTVDPHDLLRDRQRESLHSNT